MISKTLQQRYAGKALNQLHRNYQLQSFTFYKDPSESFVKRATMIPGTFIGPELTGKIS